VPPEWTSAEFAFECARRGVSISPSGPFVVPPLEPPNAVRVSLGAAETAAELRTGLGIIAGMLRCGRECTSPSV
jgi:DNA-binding transcriptional MocR family regulator